MFYNRFSISFLLKKFHLFGGTLDGGGSYARIEPLTKRSELEPPTKWSNLAENTPFSEILEDESAIWYRVNWRLLEEDFLGWYIWLKDNLGMMEGFVEEVKTTTGESISD